MAAPELVVLPRVGVRNSWVAAIERVLEDPGSIATAFQPIVDLQRGVAVGYEALARFPGTGGSPPEWFAAARDLGLGERLDAVVLAGQLRARAALPPNCFLSVNVSPDTLASDTVQRAIAAQPSLQSTVIEVTEQAQVTDYDQLRDALATARDRGAMLAVDDAGAGYASLSHVMELRPEFIKLDRWLVMDCDIDPAKRAALKMLGGLANSIDAWVVAEGIERQEELDVLVDMGIPLAQGFYLSRPAPIMTALRPELTLSLSRTQHRRTSQVGVSSLLESAPSVPAEDPGAAVAALIADSRATNVVLVDELGRPAGLVRRDGFGGRTRRPVMVIGADEPAADLLRRALVREPWLRFDPLVCRDGRGRYVGIVAMERLIANFLP